MLAIPRAMSWHHVAKQVRTRWPRLADPMGTGEPDVPASMAFPRQHRPRSQSTNPTQCLNKTGRLDKDVKRRADVVGIFPDEASIPRPIGAVLSDRNAERQTSSRHRMVEPFARIDAAIDPILGITPKAA